MLCTQRLAERLLKMGAEYIKSADIFDSMIIITKENEIFIRTFYVNPSSTFFEKGRHFWIEIRFAEWVKNFNHKSSLYVYLIYSP